ncbi:hypothetical protein KFL_000010220 [Klebsormidium nitens]|uniref:Uncharacterized protein n=1 Tax=Klebsormidium nitens TaxID=105231 RepID=A0A0U9HQY6_KLENI|nr:hypothetical protein KFL_000010220 [Klebsormidium nitens]|eukprot:GAQ77573.1 hypothetical protein KFL_000010220 [Klebsormidium nitens]
MAGIISSALNVDVRAAPCSPIHIQRCSPAAATLFPSFCSANTCAAYGPLQRKTGPVIERWHERNKRVGWRRRSFERKSRGGATLTTAALDDTRLIDFLRTIPDRSNEYFKPLWRRGIWGGVSLFGGFYIANTISLSLGANSVNDVIAAAVCTWFTEYVTKYYYSRERATFLDALLNAFKIGLQYGLFCDAFKLAS